MDAPNEQGDPMKMNVLGDLHPAWDDPHRMDAPNEQGDPMKMNVLGDLHRA
jgi:hypothetical protein